MSGNHALPLTRPLTAAMVLVQVASTQSRDPHFNDYLSGTRFRPIEFPDFHFALAKIDHAPHILISHRLDAIVNSYDSVPGRRPPLYASTARSSTQGDSLQLDSPV